MTATRTISFIAALLAGAPPAFAGETLSGETENAAASSDTIVVTGQRSEYGVRSTSTATRTNTDIRNIPQALTVISESQIEDQALRSISDILLFVPGATPGTGESNRDQMTLRGNNTTADFFRDGIRDDVQYFRDLYNSDRVEVLRGPNAMIFGRGGGGGVVNRVTKRSTLNPYRQFLAAADSSGGVRLTADVDQPLSPGLGLRVNGLYENGESFRRHVDLKRFAVNPAIGILAGPDTRIDLSYEYLRDRRTADRGVPSLNGKPLEGHNRTFFGDPDDSFSRADVHLASAAVEHDFSDAVTLRSRMLYGNYDKFYQNIYPSGAAEAGLVRLSAYDDTTKRRNLMAQTDVIWQNRLAGLDQTLLFGVELGRQTGRNQRRNGVFVSRPDSPSSIFAPIDGPTVDEPVAFTGGGANNGIKTSLAAVYVQDQIRLSPMVEIVAGLRFDRLAVEIDNRNTGERFRRSDQLWSPRLGLILKPSPSLSLYASYSRSYLPQSGDQFSALTSITEALKPERFDNYEAGAKWEPIEGLLATAAIYRLDRTNTQAKDENDLIVLTGAQRSRGLELGLERSISDRWQISAGYAWQKAEVTRTTVACPAGDCEVPLVPRHTLAVWNRYDLSSSLGLGLGVIARSKSYASLTNAVKLAGYARVDAAAFYKLTPGVEAQLNLENLLGEDYFPTAHNDNNIAPGAPRTVKASVRFGF
jgi:catecholate siderophore receptor